MKKNNTNLSFSVLFEDNHLIAVKKQSGDIIQSDKTGDVTLADNVKAYIKKKILQAWRRFFRYNS